MRPDCSTGEPTLGHFVTAILTASLAITLLAEPAASQPEATGADCGCLWKGSFSEVAPSADLVVLGEVQSVKGNAVDLVPEQLLKGEFWLDTLRVWMRTRDYCRPPADDFPLGSRWIMALSKIREVPEGGFDPSTPCLLYTSPSPRDLSTSRMPSSA